MIYELRQYRAKSGRRDDLVRVMEDEVIPFQSSKGMVIVASFVGEEDPDLFVWVRRFEDETERTRQYEAVYESSTWKDEIGPRIGATLERDQIVVTRLNPTPRSVLR
jgi:hypothetical protein